MVSRCGDTDHSGSVEEAAAHRPRPVTPETILHWRNGSTAKGEAVLSPTPERAAAPPLMENTPGTLI